MSAEPRDVPSGRSFVAFRVDSGRLIGHGHVMRCLAIAHALREMDVDPVFICRSLEGGAGRAVVDAGFDLLELTCEDTESSDAAATLEILNGMQREPRCILVDHYGLGRRWESLVTRSGYRVGAVDDGPTRSHDVSLLLDHNGGSSSDGYAPLVPFGCRIMTGIHYLLLRPEFRYRRDPERTWSQTACKFLVTLGGGDVVTATDRVLDALIAAGTGSSDVKIIVPSDAVGRDALAVRCARHEGWTLEDHVTDIPGILADRDLVIGAGGVSAWERAFLGVPSVNLILADNQVAPAGSLASSGGAVTHDARSGVDVEVLASHIRALVGDSEARAEVGAAALRATIDAAEGAAMVARQLVLRDAGLERGRYRLRPVAPDDKHRILEWRNAQHVRHWMRNTDLIGVEEHETWFARMSNDPDRRDYVFESDGVPMGVVNFTGVGSCEGRMEWGFYLAERDRPRGMGTVMGSLALDLAFEHLGARVVIGDVVAANAVSIRYHRKMGFEETPERRAVDPGESVVFRLPAERWRDLRAAIVLPQT